LKASPSGEVMPGIEDLEEQKMRLKSVLSLLLVLPVTSAFAEDAKTLASTLDVFVFPSDGQASDQQSKAFSVCLEAKDYMVKF
jgi:hypothetical protein